MTTEAAERFDAELGLLLAMYPDSLSFSSGARELKYSHRNGESNSAPPAVLLLRLPDAYPLDGVPEVISATGHYKEDLRSAAKAAFRSIQTPIGEEVLDALLLAFQELVLSQEKLHEDPVTQATGQFECRGVGALPNRTVVIWLHHLLNTNKRKLALNPSMTGLKISGITKPGHPGVLIFSGERNAVDSHITELRNQRWQAFQIRFDSGDVGISPEIWRFKHGMGICEVGSMSDIAQSILDPQQREVFLGSIGLK